MAELSKRVLLSLLIATISGGLARAGFRHPGLLHSRVDLERMKRMVQAGQEPWTGGFEVLKADHASQADYRTRGPGEEIGRSPSVNFGQFDQDANASYQCALRWSSFAKCPRFGMKRK